MNQMTSRKIKAKKLGVLIRDARQVACRSLEDCAAAMGVSTDTLQAYELGEKSPSLPELEILAFYLKIPLDHFWSDKLLETHQAEASFDAKKLVALRQKIIGVLIRKSRLEKGLTLQALADGVGIPAERLEAYEMGEQPIPVPELDHLALELGWQIKYFQDQRGPVGSWLVQQRNFEDFMNLPPELQEFISKPINHSYLAVAQRMSEMSVDKLRNIAEVLLEITF